MSVALAGADLYALGVVIVGLTTISALVSFDSSDTKAEMEKSSGVIKDCYNRLSSDRSAAMDLERDRRSELHACLKMVEDKELQLQLEIFKCTITKQSALDYLEVLKHSCDSEQRNLDQAEIATNRALAAERSELKKPPDFACRPNIPQDL
ncbi:MAG: hypothetical protein JSR99_19595 [Proteobacteria bacterium]|nr:hypothetical protein [Pseudomonadota bacterium]